MMQYQLFRGAGSRGFEMTAMPGPALARSIAARGVGRSAR